MESNKRGIGELIMMMSFQLAITVAAVTWLNTSLHRDFDTLHNTMEKIHIDMTRIHNENRK